MSILNILSEKKIISAEDVASIESEAASSGGNIQILLQKQGVLEKDILDAGAEYYEIPARALAPEEKIASEILRHVPEEAAGHYKFVPLAVQDGVLEVGIVDPDNLEARDALNFISSKINMPFKFFFITETDFEKVLGMYKGITEEVTKALSQIETDIGTDDTIISIDPETVEEKEDVKKGDRNIEAKIVEDAPITKIVQTILRYATEGNASDIHIEHLKDTIRVRFRVDGVLNTSLVLPSKVHSAIISRIKILSNMKLDEKRKPQDGRFSAKVEGRKIDFRVSTFPTFYGEKIVMRILDHERGVKKLDQLGISEGNLALIRKAIDKPYGLILISGPTGSGKTTTLYSMLGEFDKDKRNVLSLEDPIEYSIDGVNQSQIRADIGYTFANGLRTTLRQDPDIIMVGEIRDAETAQLAIQASLTGHLVLATIHTNDAVGVIPRLIDMKVDPYLIAPTLILAIAQRLVGMLCPDSGTPVPYDESLKKLIEKEFSTLPEKFRKDVSIGNEFFRASPSPLCPNGTRGRVAVMEVLEMDKDIETILLKNATEVEISKIARSKGMLSMREDAIIKASHRQIPFEEIITL